MKFHDMKCDQLSYTIKKFLGCTNNQKAPYGVATMWNPPKSQTTLRVSTAIEKIGHDDKG
jgi:hypothetical protein